MNLFIIISVITLVVLSAVYDFKYQRIPNLLTYPAILVGIIYNTYISGIEGFQLSTLGALTGVGLLIIPYFLGAMGAGDAKLLGAVGAYIGAKSVFISFLFTAVAGGIYALLILFIYNDKFKGFFTNLYYSGVNLLVTRQYVSFEDDEVSRKKPKLCYGLAIAAGTGIFMIFEITGTKVLPL